MLVCNDVFFSVYVYDSKDKKYRHEKSLKESLKGLS